MIIFMISFLSDGLMEKNTKKECHFFVGIFFEGIFDELL